MSDEPPSAPPEPGSIRTGSIRPGEIAVSAPAPQDAGLQFIGQIRTPFATRADCPRQGDPKEGPVCTLQILPLWQPALHGLEQASGLDVLYWLHDSRRDLVVQSPRGSGQVKGTFALRSPVRPNPIGLSRVTLIGIDGGQIRVRGLDCLDGTPLLDIKPARCPFAAPG